MEPRMPHSLAETERLIHDQEKNGEAEGVSLFAHRRPCWSIWVVGTCLNLLITSTAIVSYLITPNGVPFCGSIWNGDMLDAHGAIGCRVRSYTGALNYDYSKKEMVREADGGLKFFGPPSPAIDAAWHSLLHVRKELSKTVYNGAGYLRGHEHELPAFVFGNQWQATHFDHCLDRLRQAVTCHGDLTPSPLYYFHGYPLVLGRSGAHTCRKFEPIRAWMDERAGNGKATAGLD
ncbi:hypothetical protein Q7P37_003595 [Cladosporium fusiforme]